MKKLSIAVFATLLFSLLVLPTASALTIEAGENVLISDNLLDDVYVAGANATVESTIFGDLYITGGNINITGNINEDLVVAGGKVTITGNVAGDLRVAGGQVAIYGNVGDDLVVAGGQVDIGKSSVIGGTLLSGAGLLTLDGEVGEEIRGGVGAMILNGKVGGDVTLTVEDTLTISDKASIGGNLKYSAVLEKNIPDGVVAGTISFNQFEKENILKDLTYFFLVTKLLSLLGALLIALLFVLFAPTFLMKNAQETKENVLKSLGIGALAFLTAIIAPVLLMITIIGIPIAVILLAAFVAAFYLAKVYAAAWLVGYFVNFKKKISPMKFFGYMALALLAYYVIGMIPFIGWLANMVLFLIGLGAVIMGEMGLMKFLKSKKML